MTSSRKSSITGITSIASSSIALGISLILVPLIRAFPESIGIKTFIFLAITLVIIASIGVFVGSLGLKSDKRTYHLVGLMMGQLVLSAVILYSFAPLFR
jgi:hypothetical protein